MERDKDFGNIILLMQKQNNYISQVARMIHQICSDAAFGSNRQFQEFTTHFITFMQNQAGSEGYSRALNLIHSFHYSLIERLLDQEILVAAEQLELAVGYLETITKEVHFCVHPYMLLLNQGIALLEETELNIIESLERYIEDTRPFSLQN